MSKIVPCKGDFRPLFFFPKYHISKVVLCKLVSKHVILFNNNKRQQLNVIFPALKYCACTIKSSIDLTQKRCSMCVHVRWKLVHFSLGCSAFVQQNKSPQLNMHQPHNIHQSSIMDLIHMHASKISHPKLSF